MIKTCFSSETEPLPLYALDEWWTHFNASAQYSSQFTGEVSKVVTFPSFDKQQSLLPDGKIQLTSDIFATNNAPLAVMAMHQKVANVDLLVEHLHLAMSVQFIVTFSLKGARPLSLFSSSVQAYFFKDLLSFLHSSSVNSSESPFIPADPVLCEARYKFLYNVITGIVQTLPVYRDEADRHEGNQFYRTANVHFSKVVLLTREWNLNVDKVRLRYVYDLFLFGCDPLAEEVISHPSIVFPHFSKAYFPFFS